MHFFLILVMMRPGWVLGSVFFFPHPTPISQCAASRLLFFPPLLSLSIALIFCCFFFFPSQCAASRSLFSPPIFSLRIALTAFFPLLSLRLALTVFFSFSVCASRLLFFFSSQFAPRAHCFFPFFSFSVCASRLLFFFFFSFLSLRLALTIFFSFVVYRTQLCSVLTPHFSVCASRSLFFPFFFSSQFAHRAYCFFFFPSQFAPPAHCSFSLPFVSIHSYICSLLPPPPISQLATVGNSKIDATHNSNHKRRRDCSKT